MDGAWASLLPCPVTFSRILARLSKRGLLETHGNNIVLKNIAGLRELVQI